MLAAMLVCATLGREPTVTFTHPCAHSSVILKALGQEIGMTLRPRGSVDKDYFLVRFDDLPVEEALDRIAETLNATWIGDGNVRYLDRTDEDHREELETVFQLIDKFLADNPLAPYPSVQELVPELAGLENLDSSREADREKYTSLREYSPLRRALIKVLKSFSKDDILRMSTQEEVEFYARPLEFEMPFTKTMTAAHQDMLDEYEVLLDAAGRAGVPQGKQYLPGYFRLLEPDKLENANFGFVVELDDTGFAIRVRDGQRGSHYGIDSIDESAKKGDWPSYPELEGTNVPYVGRLEHIEFFKSITAREQRLLSTSYPKLPTWTQNALLDLETFEPLGMHRSDVLLQLARLKAWDMVALLADSSLIPWFPFKLAKDLREEVEWVLGSHEMELDADAKFVAITPYWLRRIRQNRWDRKAISQAIRLCKQRNWFDLEAMAMIYDTWYAPGGEALDLTVGALFENRLGAAEPVYDPGGLLALYAALPEKFRQQARLGPVKAPAATMDERVRSIVRSRLRRGGFRDKGYVDPHPRTEWYANVISGEREVPEKYYSGPLPLDVVIELTHKTSCSFIGEPVVERNSIHVTGLMNADELASDFLFAKEHGHKPDLVRVMVVSSEKVTIKISVPGLEYGVTFVTSGAALTDGFVTHNRLPPALRTELREAIARHGG